MPKIVLRIMWREWKRILGEKRVVTLLIGGPFFYAFVFGGVYYQGRTMHVPIVVVDQDHSALSREITTALRSSENISVAESVDSPQDFLPLLRRDKAYACVVFPFHFERDLLAGRGPRVEAIMDGSNILIAGTTLTGIRNVVNSFQVAVDSRELAASGVAYTTAVKVLSHPIESVARPLFNPTSNYCYFMLMCLVCVATQSVTRMALGVALGLDERTQLQQDLGGAVPEVRWIFLGKVIASVTFVLLAGGSALTLPFLMFGAPNRGSALAIAIAWVLFAITQVCLAYAYFGLFRDTIICLQFHIFTAVLFSIVSGYTWPTFAMPIGIQYVSRSISLFQMIGIVRRISLLGVDPLLLWRYFLALIAWTFVSILWGYWAVSRHFSSKENTGSTVG